MMDVPSSSQAENGLIKCHITYGCRKAVLKTTPATIKQDIITTFNIQSKDILIQAFASQWDDWIDVPLSDVTDGTKLKVQLLHMQRCGKDVLPVSLPVEHKFEEINSQLQTEISDELEGKMVPSTSGKPRKKLIRFSDMRHPLTAKLRNGEQLNKKETRELVKKVFFMIMEHNTYPTSKELMDYVKRLLADYPSLQGDDEAKVYHSRWIKLLQKKFASFRNVIVQREQKPKADKMTQTGLGNKPWQVWHPVKQNVEENHLAFQDMSPIMVFIKQEYLKPQRDEEKIEQLMCLTFQYRRGFIINTIPKVVAVQEIYPALFNCDEVRREFLRITGKENDGMFRNNIEQYSHIIYDLTRVCALRSIIDHCIGNAKSQKKHYDWKNAGLLLLPYLLKEDLSFMWFQNQEFDGEQIEPYIKCNADMKVVAEGGGYFQVFVENVLLVETSEFIVAVECFLASFFIFLIEYRADAKHTLQLLQSFFFEYDDPSEEDIHPRVVRMAEQLKEKMKQQNRYVKL